MNHKLWLKVFLGLGIIDSIYLTIVHFVPRALDCPTLGALVNCESVLTSSLSNVFGIPLALIGLVWFVVSMVMVFRMPHRIVKNVWMIAGAGGIVYSLVGQTLIGKICIYCSALDILIALSVGAFLYMKDKT